MGHMNREERQVLDLFCERAYSIASSPLYRNGSLGPSISIKWEQGSPLALEQKGPSTSELLPIVVVVRQLYLQKESINFNKVYNIVHKYLSSSNTTSETIMGHVRSAMSGFKQIMNSLPIVLNIAGKVVTPREIIDIWFNGNMFHADPQKSAIYKELWSSPAGPIAEFLFRSTIVHLATLMVYFGSLIQAEVLKETKEN